MCGVFCLVRFWYIPGYSLSCGLIRPPTGFLVVVDFLGDIDNWGSLKSYLIFYSLLFLFRHTAFMCKNCSVFVLFSALAFQVIAESSVVQKIRFSIFGAVLYVDVSLSLVSVILCLCLCLLYFQSCLTHERPRQRICALCLGKAVKNNVNNFRKDSNHSRAYVFRV